MKSIVLDASVALKWYLRDEEYFEKALKLLEDFVSGAITIAVPDLIFYELMNGLLVAQRRGRMPLEVVNSAMDGFTDLDLEMVGLSSLYGRILYFAGTYDRSIYDAAYLALAESRKISYITGDKRLYNTVQNKLKWVRWIGDI